jgi:hypothetical protein
MSTAEIFDLLMATIRQPEAVQSKQPLLELDSLEFLQIQLWFEDFKLVDRCKFLLFYDPQSLQTKLDFFSLIEKVRK